MNVLGFEKLLNEWKSAPTEELALRVLSALHEAEFICPYAVDTHKTKPEPELFTIEAVDDKHKYLGVFTSVEEMAKMTGDHRPQIKIFNYPELERALISPYNHQLYGFIINCNSHHVKIPILLIKEMILSRAKQAKAGE